MALEDLIGQVPDRALRTELEAALRELKGTRRFGLVFNRRPETTLVRDFPIRAGMTVYRRSDLGLEQPLIVTVSDVVSAEVVPEGAPDAPLTTVAASDLFVLKRFREPIYPALTPVGSVREGGDKPSHSVIEAENYHALQLLGFLHEGEVDCIYLDPPYNTGARDWKYNNNYVDDRDAFRHSKWLNMMEKRLRLARRLLKQDGVLVITIDEHELHHLGVLVEQIFPEYLRYMVSVVINSRGSTGNRNFGVIEEQALFVVPDLGYDVIQPREACVPYLVGRTEKGPAGALLSKVLSVIPDLETQLTEGGEGLDDAEIDLLAELEDDELDEADLDTDEGAEAPVPGEYWHHAHRTGQGTSFRTQRKSQFYPLFIDPDTKEIVRVGEPLLDVGPDGQLVPPCWDTVDGLVPIWPVDTDGHDRVWCYEPERMRNEIAIGNIKVGSYVESRKTYAVNVRRVRRTQQRFRERTIWWEPSYDAGSNGTNILKNLLGRSGAFPFPKSVYAVRDTLATVVGNRPDALIVDLFAGSGTTLHATCLLNAHDGGSRRTILVTNNEVEDKLAAELAAQGLYPGDPEYDKHGIFQAVTVPRVTAAVTGFQPGGRPVPGRYKWAGRRPMAEGFEENVSFFRLDYLEPDEVELGLQLKAILPALWLRSGGVGDLPEPDSSAAFLMSGNAPFALLLKESAFREFLSALRTRSDIRYAWLVTDSERAFAEMRAALPSSLRVSMLYRDYLRTFAINTGGPS